MSFREDVIEDAGLRRRFRVVAALISDKDRVLLTQRWPNRHLGFMWEFPGGKVEAGESDEIALKRELQEELGVDVKVGNCCFETCHGYGQREVHLLIFRCQMLEGTPSAIDVKAVEWVPIGLLANREFPPADMLFVQELIAGRIEANWTSEDAENDEEMVVVRPATVVRPPPR